jgi:cystathionine gamma-lyase
MKFETRAIHVGEEPNFKDGGCGDVVSPIHLSSTFARQKVDFPTQGYEYSRTKNPTRDALEKRLASLENARFGLAFASGLAAETTLLISLLRSHDHVIAFDDLYGGTKRLFNRVLQDKFSIQFTYVDARNIEEIQKSILPNTKVIWLETPSNPLLKIADIQKVAALAKKHNLLLVVDNTFMSPYFQQPLNWGADIVLHSTTKYLNGHSDSIGGAIMLNDKENYDKIQFMQNACGAILSPFESYLILRSLKTLAVRMKQHEHNALKLSQYLEGHKKVNKVIYPGLLSHPEHTLAKQQMSGFGGMLSFELKADLENTKRFVEGLRYFSIAESLGGVESLCEIPSLMTHASIPKTERDKIGLSDSLIRLSVGIEHLEDLQADLENAFKSI